MTKSTGIEFSIPPEHPALAGHFPGNPVVPGVVLLECVARAARTTLGPRIEVTGLPHVKFSSPLRPGELFEIHIERGNDGIANFIVQRGPTRIARGRLHYAPAGSLRP